MCIFSEKKGKQSREKNNNNIKWNGRYTINVCNKGKMSSVCVIDSMNNLIQYTLVSLPLAPSLWSKSASTTGTHIGTTNTHTYTDTHMAPYLFGSLSLLYNYLAACTAWSCHTKQFKYVRHCEVLYEISVIGIEQNCKSTSKALTSFKFKLGLSFIGFYEPFCLNEI